MGKYVYILALVLASWVLFGNNAMSETPDGETPAEEDVCDGLNGAAYGLCVSYCEAMDCGDGNRSSERACERVRENYQRIEGTGKAFPCECPCNYYLVPPTTACLAEKIDNKDVVYTTRELSLVNSEKEVMSSIMAEDADAVEMMYQDVIVRDTEGRKSGCAVMVKGTNPCVQEAIKQAPKDGVVDIESPRVLNACQIRFAQYAQDAIANGVLVEIQAEKSKAIISTVP